MHFLIFCAVCVLFPRTVALSCVDKVFDSCRSNSRFCNRICDEHGCQIRAAVILPNDTNLAIASIPNVLPLLKKAIDDAYVLNILPRWINITLIAKDDQCDASFAQIATIDSYSSQNCVHVIFGPVCDYCLATVSRIVKFFGTPLLTAGGFSDDFDKKKVSCQDEYYMLVRTGKLVFKGLSQFFKKISISYGWRKVAFLYDKEGQKEVAGESTCSLMMQTLAQELKQVYGFQYKDGDLGLSTFNISEFLKQDIGVNYGIIVMCASQERIHDILLGASELENMVLEGEYIFFNIELTSRAKFPDRPWIEHRHTDPERTEKLKVAYQNVITLTSLAEEVVDRNITEIRKKTNYTSGFYDAMMLYLVTIKDFLQEGGPEQNLNTTINGYEVVCKMFDVKFKGLSGVVEMNQNGDRRTHYSLLSFNPHRNRFDVVANYTKEDENFTFIEGKQIYWKNGQDSPPPDTPICGYDKSKCAAANKPLYMLGVLSFLIMIVIIIGFGFNQHKLNKSKIEHWRINKDYIELIDKKPIQKTFQYYEMQRRDEEIQTCLYKNNETALKTGLHFKNTLTTLEKKRLNELYGIQHEHLVKFFGICFDPPHPFILTEFCPKGSLQDLLKSENVDKIMSETMLKVSFIQDLILGMHYLHQSEITHGALSSTNCVVDNRLVLKISDYGLHFLYNRHERIKDEKYWKSQLWTAPELLRMDNPPKEGTQKGDVYSFAIIVHEIAVRRGPFYLGDNCKLTPRDIVEAVKTDKSLRPLTVDKDDITDLMRRCWAENEADRPDFSALKNTIKKLNKDHESGDVMDNLLSRLEQYANNLETLVEERTADYMDEKRKCENLLYQLLPKEVAKQLISGAQVLAETYDQVTIYFSDIVGFTALSATSQPMEIVEFLNDLYTCFDGIIENYDVYKVETIGDAYMVVSGLPLRNGNLHAREVARVALAVQRQVATFRIKHRPSEKLRVRIGLHTGPCVAGVVGQKMPRYCLFGDTVNTASRMETCGLPERIHVSHVTKAVLDTFGTFELERRGEVELKATGGVGVSLEAISEHTELLFLPNPLNRWCRVFPTYTLHGQLRCMPEPRLWGKGKMVTYWLNGERKQLSRSSSTESIAEAGPSNAIALPIVAVSSSQVGNSQIHHFATMSKPPVLKIVHGVNDLTSMAGCSYSSFNGGEACSSSSPMPSTSKASYNSKSGAKHAKTNATPTIVNRPQTNVNSTTLNGRSNPIVQVNNPIYSEEDDTAPLLSLINEKKS